MNRAPAFVRWISGLLVACLSASPAAADRSFTIAVVPDTQNYVDYQHQKAEGFAFDASELFLEQMRHIAANAQSQGGDIAFVTALGDMWQHGSLHIDPEHEARGFRRVDNPYYHRGTTPTPKTRSFEIPLTRKGYEILAGKVPFSVVPGNHDYDAQWSDARFPPQADAKDVADKGILHVGGLSNFESVFSGESSFFKGKPWYVASHDGGADSAQVFTAGGYHFLHIGLQFDAPNATLKWATSMIARFKGLPTIISTHNYLDPSGERRFGTGNDNNVSDPEDNNPQMVWDKLISQNDQIFMVLCGHRTSNGQRIEPNRFGHAVYQLLSDYQARQQTAKAAGVRPPGGGIGDGWMRLMIFSMEAEVPSVQVRTYSTFYKKFSTEMTEYVPWYKAAENPGLTDEEFHAKDDFRLELTDFRARFGGQK